EGEPANIKFGDTGAKYFVESTIVFTTMEEAMSYLKGKSKRVIISSTSADTPKFVIVYQAYHLEKAAKYDDIKKVLKQALEAY
ncbi:hypothetical protein A6R68_01879, partial [Neotoma lepida]